MTPMLRPMLLAAAAAMIAFAAPVGPGIAAQGSSTASSQPGPEPGRAAIKEFTDEELKSFAEASLQVERIGSKWNPRISDAGSKSDEEEMREQAMNEMVSAVQEKGLSVDRYNRIALAVQSDPDIARAVQSYRAAQP